MRLIVTDVRTLRQQTPNVREMEFHEASVDIGSHSNSKVQLPDFDIAAHHATIAKTADGEWIYKPATRDDQTFLNDESLIEEIKLTHGDIIKVAHFTIECQLDAAFDRGAMSSQSAKPRESGKIRQFPLPPRSVVRRSDTEVSLVVARQRDLSGLVAKLRNCGDSGQLIERVAKLLHTQLEARLVWVGVRKDPNGPIERMFGRSDRGDRSNEPPELATFTYRCLERHQFICVPKSETPELQSILAIPLMIGRDAMGLIYADSRRYVRVFDEADLDYMTVVAGAVASHVEALADDDSGVAGMGDASGKSLVRNAQERLIEPDLPHWPGLDVVAFARTGQGNAEDIHDVVRLPNGLVAMLIAQVAAESTWSILTMAQIRGAFRIAGLHADRPHVQLQAWNWLLHCDSVPGEVNVAVVVLNPKTGVLECGTAGGIGALIVGSDGKPRKLTDSNSLPLGARKQTEYKPIKGRLLTGETLALYTGGCATLRSDEGKEFGSREFLKLLCASCGQPANVTLEEIKGELRPYLEGGEAPNDMTVVLAYRSEYSAS